MSEEERERALTVVRKFRSAHSYPLGKAQMGLRSMLRTVGVDGEVTSRMKRMATILDKITIREPRLALSKMQDIGGCRVVVDTLQELRAVEARLRRARPAVAYDDYIEHPRSSGYRSVHYVVNYTDRTEVPRRIEIQLRTERMHRWALLVERLSSVAGLNLKSDGDHEIQQIMAILSKVTVLQEKGVDVPQDILDTVNSLLHTAMKKRESGV